MRFTSSFRRAGGLLTVATLGMSTAVLAVAGSAQAALQSTNGVITVPANTCGISLSVVGASGGDAGGGVGGLGGLVELNLVVQAGETFYVEVGTAGAGGGVEGGGGADSDGGIGGASAGGGGGGTALYYGDDATGELLAIAGGGGGAGTTATGGDADTGGASSPGEPTGGDAGTWDGPGYGGTSPGGTDGGDGVEGLGGNGAAPNGGGGGGGWNGGGGGASDATDGAGGGGGASYSDYADNIALAASPGDGFVDYAFQTCRVPDAPELTLTATGDTTADIEFWPAAFDDYDPASAVTGWEYTVDGGPAQSLTLTSGSGEDLHSATVSGLTNGVAQQIRVHATSASGDGTDSAPVSVTPYAPLGAPGNIAFTKAADSVTFTWDASAAGTFALDHYEAALVYSTGESGGATHICQTDPATRTCTAPAQPGLTYSLSVHAVDSAGNDGEWSELVPIGTFDPPAAVPASDGALQAPEGVAGGIAPGETVTITGTGYKPNSVVTVLIYSTPQVLTTVVTDGTGSFSVEITVPAGLSVGQHTLVAAGIDPSGALRYMTLPVTVTEDGAALAYTGADVGLPLFGGLAALAVGGGLLLAGRRRTVATATATATAGTEQE